MTCRYLRLARACSLHYTRQLLKLSLTVQYRTIEPPTCPTTTGYPDEAISFAAAELVDMAAAKDALRREVIAVYKGMTLWSSPWHIWAMLNGHTELLNLGKDYPLGYSYFRPRLHKAFSSQAGLTDEAEIRKALDRAYFVQKGMNRLNVFILTTKLICAAEIEALFVNTPP